MMQPIDWYLYETQGDYRELEDRLRATERENEALRAQLGKRWETTGLSPWKASDSANPIPYQRMVQPMPKQREAPREAIRKNYAVYWSKPKRNQETVNETQREDIRRGSHSTLRSMAYACRRSLPEASLVFDTLGALTAENSLEGIESINSIIGAARAMDEE